MTFSFNHGDDMNQIEYGIGGRTITIRKSERRRHLRPPSGWTDWDVFDGEQLLTTTDPWSTDDGPPTEQQIRAYLQPRRQRLQVKMARHRIMAGPDYDYDDVYEELFPDHVVAAVEEEPPRWLSITRDETYAFFDLSPTFGGAANSLASRVGGDTGGVPVGIFDLETGRWMEVGVHTLVYERDIEAEAAVEDYTELVVHWARKVLTAAMNELETAILARVSMLIKRQHPTAARLLYDGEENEMGLLHVYVREIQDADGNVLDSQDDSSDSWEELIDQDVEPLLWEVSERDQSYYGEGRILELND